MLRPPIDGADPSTSAHHRSLNVVPELKRVFHRAQNLLNLSPGTCQPSSPISPILFSCTKKKQPQIQAQAWLYCGLADTVVAVVPAAAVAAATAAAATVAMTAAVTMTAAVMTTVAAAAVAAAAMTAVSVAILLYMRSNSLTTAFPADGATGAAAASATIASLQRRRYQRHADLPASAHAWLCWDRALAAGAKHPYSPPLSLFSLSSLSLFSFFHLSLSLILEQNHSFVHFPHHISLKLMLFAEKA